MVRALGLGIQMSARIVQYTCLYWVNFEIEKGIGSSLRRHVIALPLLHLASRFITQPQMREIECILDLHGLVK